MTINNNRVGVMSVKDGPEQLWFWDQHFEGRGSFCSAWLGARASRSPCQERLQRQTHRDNA